MGKRRVSLEEAKKILKNDKVFIAGKNYNVLDTGKYHSGWTLVLPQEWELDENDNPMIPDIYDARKCTELTDGMNLDFNAECFVRFGRYRKSTSGKPVFELTDPKDAKHVMITADWGGPFIHTRGNHYDDIKETGVLEFTRARSNGGGTGYDYYIVPIDYINDPMERDVSEIVRNEQKKREKEREERRNKIERTQEERKTSRSNKEAVIAQIMPMLEAFKEKYGEEIGVKFGEYTLELSRLYIYNISYSQEAVEKISKGIEELSARKEIQLRKEEAQKTLTPRFKEYEQALLDIEAELKIDRNGVKVTFLTPELPSEERDRYGYIHRVEGKITQTYEYSEDDFNRFVADLLKAIDDYKERKSAERQKEDEVKKKAQRVREEAEAKEQGYPSEFKYRNRLHGATGLSHAYVITKEGHIREPDDNLLDNRNHSHHYSDRISCILEADGNQIYNQIMPGDIIVSYFKSCTREPYIVDIEWADQMPTEDQMLVMMDVLKGLVPEGYDQTYVTSAKEYQEGSENEPITDFKSWIMERVKEKLDECRSTLKKEVRSAINLRGIEDNSSRVVDASKRNDDNSEL